MKREYHEQLRKESDRQVNNILNKKQLFFFTRISL